MTTTHPIPGSSHLNVATHSGPFHADDVFACAAIMMLDPCVSIIRTRDPNVIKDAHIVVDVGGVYNPGNGRFDHHMKDRAGARPNGVLYSGFGLIWLHYGEQLCARFCPSELAPLGGRPFGTDAVADRVDRALVQAIDASDNGQELYTGGRPNFDGAEQYSLSAAISAYNPSWHEPTHFDACFMDAVDFAMILLRREISSAWGEIMARAQVTKAIEQAKRTQNPGIVMLHKFMPWGDQVRDEHEGALFCVFPSEGLFMVQAVNAAKGTFKSRKLLPEAWAGLRDVDFQKLVCSDDAVFCHPGRFICGAKTLACAFNLAVTAVNAR